ncbi:calpain-C-like [Limulus polyphemus]|uniref:Calpain-C-like n=1 Tax=Limulus polyphemus TaxID=6850 RepID=A0ABM1B9Z8_LIMPO|nr:calpain-C-like [Limulus polyphemus]
MSEFEKLKIGCLKKGELFEDPDFPATQASVFYHKNPPFQFIWKRPKELCSNPLFLLDGAGQFDINPGKLGDRWFVSCIGCLAISRGLFYRVVPADQTFLPEDYAGIFRFRLWWNGEWQEVIVDDRLPTVNNKLVFVHSQHSNQFWPALLEKAYAKLHTAYEVLKYGCAADGLADLTGGITETIDIRHESTACGRILLSLLSMTSLLTAVVQQDTQSLNQPEKLANGILLTTNYRVMCFEKQVETVNGEHIQLIRLRNPLGATSEYVGNWSRDCSQWDLLAPHERTRIKYKNLAEGEFWMAYQDFVKTFTTLEVVHLDGETSKDEPTLRGKTPWLMKLWYGRWQRGVSAGGCRNHTDTFHTNPQLRLILSDNQEVIISLTQHSALNSKIIGFTIYGLPKTNSELLPKSFFKRNKSLLNSQYSNSRQVSARQEFQQGGYVLLPTSFEPGQESGFTVRVYSNKPIKLKLIDNVPSVVKPAIMKAPPSFDSKVSSYEVIFHQLADEHKSVNVFQLQELLETCLPNDYVKSCATLDVCRQVILALDNSGTGRLVFSDYKNLMCSLKYWQTTFKAHTKATTGILRAENLRDVLFDIGFQLNTEILCLLVIRYMRKDGTLRFGDFVSCILHLSIAFATFEKKDPLQNGYVKFSLSEWLKASLQC